MTEWRGSFKRGKGLEMGETERYDADRHNKTEANRERERQTDRQTDRQAGKQAETGTERQRLRHTDRQHRDRQAWLHFDLLQALMGEHSLALDSQRRGPQFLRLQNPAGADRQTERHRQVKEKLCITHKNSTQNLACSQRQMHTVHTCKLSQAKTGKKHPDQ